VYSPSLSIFVVYNIHILGSEPNIVNPWLCKDNHVRFHCYFLIESLSHLLRGLSLRRRLRLVTWRGVEYLLIKALKGLLERTERNPSCGWTDINFVCNSLSILYLLDIVFVLIIFQVPNLSLGFIQPPSRAKCTFTHNSQTIHPLCLCYKNIISG